MSIADIRQSYEKNSLLEANLAATPLEQFNKWFTEALNSNTPEPTAMTLATASATGRPSARTVLLKGFDEHGFVFFTNYESRKGLELTANPHASLLFFWPALERQIRLEGTIEKTSEEESDDYFNSRPLSSRIGAWVSPQSQPITREELKKRTTAMTKSLGTEPPRPPHWGGYRLVLTYAEFWQGRPSRLHDRLIFQLDSLHLWTSSRLAP
ncbi:MAG: pyridoxamine 5'-phosphate oxidase [Burkholderiaceae bacterium]